MHVNGIKNDSKVTTSYNQNPTPGQWDFSEYRLGPDSNYQKGMDTKLNSNINFVEENKKKMQLINN